MNALPGIYEDLVVNGPLKELKTYILSQDHLGNNHYDVLRATKSQFLLFSEHFFGNVRSSLGANNNPNCSQFMAIFKRLLVTSEIRGRNGSCQDFGLVKPLVLNLMSQRKRLLTDSRIEEDEVRYYFISSSNKVYVMLGKTHRLRPSGRKSLFGS